MKEEESVSERIGGSWTSLARRNVRWLMKTAGACDSSALEKQIPRPSGLGMTTCCWGSAGGWRQRVAVAPLVAGTPLAAGAMPDGRARRKWSVVRLRIGRGLLEQEDA